MIQCEIPTGRIELRTCICNRQPLLIQSRGNDRITVHIECTRCAVCTAPSADARRAARDWNDQRLHQLADLRNLREFLPRQSGRAALAIVAASIRPVDRLPVQPRNHIQRRIGDAS